MFFEGFAYSTSDSINFDLHNKVKNVIKFLKKSVRPISLEKKLFEDYTLHMYKHGPIIIDLNESIYWHDSNIGLQCESHIFL